jgi:hypothetical protein
VIFMRTRVALLAAFVMLVLPASALASLADEQRAGQALIAQLHAGTKTCRDLSAEDFDHIGEYAMFRALGSTSLHQAMNDRMTTMLGEQRESRMHQLMGERYTGCSAGSSGAAGYGGMMGSGMMGGPYGSAGIVAMMGSGDRSWMMRGAWQHMTRDDWQRLQQRLLGASASRGGGWSALAIVAVTLGGVLLVALVIFAVVRRPVTRPPTAASPT